MIFNMVGGGGGSGATLVVSSPVNVSVTVSKDDKSYTKNSGSFGSTTFKGLATGTWTVTISGNGQTATKTIGITADYAITITFFSATINVTYPARSTCTATDGTTTLTAPDTSGTWVCVVPNAGTWIVSCTDGTQTASQTVSITAEGQTKSVDLAYTLYIFKAGEGAKVEYYAGHGSKANIAVGTNKITTSYSGDTGEVESCFRTKDKYNLSNYATLYLDLKNSKSLSDNYRLGVYISTTAFTWEDINRDPSISCKGYPEVTSTRKTYTLDVSNMQGEYYVGFGGAAGAEIYNFWLE